MADIAIFRINYKSDFILTLNSDAGWMTPFCIKFWTGAPSQAYFAGYDGETYTHCAPVDGEPTKLRVQFDDHRLPIGDLKFQISYHFTVADFPTSVEDEVLNQASVIIEVDDVPAQVMLDLNGETAPEIEFSLPAYANEAQRIANEQARIAAEQQRIANEDARIQAEETRQYNEQQRIQHEEERVSEFARLKSESEAATTAANAAATLANEKAQLADDKATLAQAAATLANEKAQLAADKAALAQAAATLANEKAALAQQKATYAQTQGDYAKEQGDYAKAQGDTAQADHVRAEADHTTAADDHSRAEGDHTTAASDHSLAESDHTTAASDHSLAESDHTTAASDHSRAESDHTTSASDHTRAEADHTTAASDHETAASDHTRAESDHAAVEVYVDSLGAFDISSYHATGGELAKYADLTAALGTDGANIPESLRKGGMSVKFVQSSDNNYVQYFLTKNQWSASETDWEKMNLEKEVNSSPAYYDRTDFLSENLYVGDIGVHARVLPTSGHSEVKSIHYRYIWVKVLAGDSIHTYTRGYTDNVSIGFSTDRSFENFTVLDATDGTKERSATAQSDGYFFVGLIYIDGPTQLNNKIWCVLHGGLQERSLVGSEIGSDYIQLVASAGQTKTISYVNVQTTLIYKVQKGDIISSKVRQYGDTAAIFFSTNYPSVGGSAKCLVAGVTLGGTPLTLLEATAPDDGYVGITYLNTLSSPIAEQKVFTDEPLFYDIVGIEEITDEVAKKKEIDLSIDDATDIKNIQAVCTTGQTATVSSKNTQTSLIYKVRKGETIKAGIRQYVDTASVSFSENIPVVGSSVAVLDVGTGDTSAKDVQGTAPADGYIMLTYLNNRTDPISGIKIVRLIYNYDYEIKEIDRRVDGIKAIEDFRNAIQFTPAQMESGSSMQNWTGQDVINNIYEPLRASHPEYITRRSLGKDPTNTYDIWLYEFNNNVDELFGLQQKTSFASNIILPEESGLTAKQCAIKKTTFDEFFDSVQYKNIYFLVSFSVRKLEAWTSKVETTINGETYYVFTFDSDVAVTTVSEQSALEVWWTKAVKTYDQHCMIISGVHADEVSGYIGTGLALKYLVENHANNPSLDYIYNHVKLSVVPIFNVWGANQSPKSRTDYYGNQTNSWVAGSLTHEQQIVADYVESVKDELSFFADFHTSEFWNNYGFVYAITIPHVTLYPAIVAAANYLCKHWFPDLPPYNWNIGGASPTSGTIYSVKYMYNTFGIQGSDIESCGKDLMAFGNCEKWSAQYMTYVVENYLNFLLAICCIRIKNNSKNIEENDDFVRDVMS